MKEESYVGENNSRDYYVFVIYETISETQQTYICNLKDKYT